MFKGLLNKVVGDPNERQVKKLQPLVDAINALEPEMERRTDAELRGLTDRFRTRLASGEALDDLLPEAFAAVREAAKRSVDMRPFDVQLIGGIVLHQGKVAEMKTGEGKTLVATMPVYLNALLGRGVHLVTVNDYLARRDALWMGAIYHLLGMNIGLLQSGAEQPAYLYDPGYRREPYPGLRPVPRREAYAADITYGTNNEFGFDYLRDNLTLELEARVQRPLYYAIVDEVDNIFIDEARTPLIISGPSDEPVEEYARFAAIARTLEPGVHYEVDEKERNVFLTDEGLAAVERETGIENIYDEANYRYVHYMQQALKAQVLFQEGRDYIRQRKQIVLIDQHTGRLMPDRRLSEGLHQAIEAKEGVPIRPRDVVSATVTIQNYFRMYEKLAGMSGTALTEAEEFYKIYNLDVVAIPTHRPMIRVDHPDVVYRSEEAKLRAVAREILACHSRGQPVLVGTTSVELSERVSGRLSAERLQLAALAPRVAYALQDADLSREARAEMRQTLNASLEAMNMAAWRKMARDLGLDPNALSEDNLAWIAEQLGLAVDPGAPEFQAMERALRGGIPHQVLNAKEHTREATIIARAGEPGTVTIATNMAGRGVDIRLGGELSEEQIHKVNLALAARGLDPFKATPAQVDSAIAEVMPQYSRNRDLVLAVGGLHILGTERHEARRIDNQLRGRAGRQGEPGSSRFYLSLEDDLMRRFGRRELIAKLMEQIGDDIPIEHSLVSRVIAQAQTSVEGYNFEIRKHLLEYDDVLNRQRQTIYDERLKIMQSTDLRDEVVRMLDNQVREYLEKRGEDGAGPAPTRGVADSAVFAGLDEVLPLILPPANSPFQGPLAFGGQLTAFPPFSIGFLADQLAGRPLEEVRNAVWELARRAAADYGDQLRQVVGEIARTTQEKYDESLGRYQALLDEKIEDFLQLTEERGRALDLRALAQHLERTFPFRLSSPAGPSIDLDDLRESWHQQVETLFHRGTCTGLIERVQARLPLDIRLDRVRPAYIPPERVGDELRRVLDLAAKQPSTDGQGGLERLSVPAEPGTDHMLQAIETVRSASTLDQARLDRLVGHVLGRELDDLMARYQDAAPASEARLRRDLDRLRETVAENKKGGRLDLATLLRQLNDMVHLEIEDLASLLEVAVDHEYEKWAQRQLSEIQSISERTPLADNSWAAIAEHLLALHFTQKQGYDREHRRRTVWAPRFPFSLMVQAQVEGVEPEQLHEAILGSLRWAIEQREQSWGQQEFKRWAGLSLNELDRESYETFLTYLGERELGDQRDRPVEDLELELYDRLRFILALRRLREQHVRLADMPGAEQVLARLGEAIEAQILDRPVRELDEEQQERILAYHRRSGLLDDPALQARLVSQPIRDWDRRTRDQVAAFLGQQFIQAHKDRPVQDLEPKAREVTVSYLQRQRYFVDEGRVQRFLIHQRLSDVGQDLRQASLLHLARLRLDRVAQRKISNLDVNTREAVLTSLQQAGYFTDPGRREELLKQPPERLDPALWAGFGTFLARQQLAAGRSLRDLGKPIQSRVIEVLKRDGALVDRERAERLRDGRLDELDGATSGEIRAELIERFRADLSAKTMEELPAATRQLVRQTLEACNYFVDEEKVGWYERRTLAQLPSEALRGLEEHLGQMRLAEVAGRPFRDLPAEIQNALVSFFDQEGLLSDRAERLRLTQTGRLGDLPETARQAVARHLGRQWVASFRDRRPSALPDDVRELVWAYLRGRGLFNDEFKAELFSYQRLNEFDGEIQASVETGVVGQFVQMLDTEPVGRLPEDVQVWIRQRLDEAAYLIDQDLLREVQERPVQDLPPETRQAVETALAETLLSGLQAEGGPTIGALPPEIQTALWRYLDEIGYFLDETKRSQILGRRLADLSADLYEQIVQDLARYLDAEIGETPIAELTEDLRHGLREAVESLGFFDLGPMDEARLRILAQPLGSLRREDLEALGLELGRARLASWTERELPGGQPIRLVDLPASERDPVLAHLQSRGWFLDAARLEQLQGRRLRDLEAGARQELGEALREEALAALRQRQVADLERELRPILRPALEEVGLELDEVQLRLLRNKKLRDLDPDVYRALVRDLGSELVSDWGAARFSDLPEDRQALVEAYLGRRIMGRIERIVLIHTISRLWIDYLTDIEDLRRGIGLEAYGQRDPLVEYKRRAFELFGELSANIRRTVVRTLFRYPPEPLRAQ